MGAILRFKVADTAADTCVGGQHRGERFARGDRGG
jgi:hypothetical protein